jgi:hypothetical protein
MATLGLDEMVYHRRRDAHPAGAGLNYSDSLKQIAALMRSPSLPDRPKLHVKTAGPAE